MIGVRQPYFSSFLLFFPPFLSVNILVDLSTIYEKIRKYYWMDGDGRKTRMRKKKTVARQRHEQVQHSIMPDAFFKCLLFFCRSYLATTFHYKLNVPKFYDISGAAEADELGRPTFC